MNWPTSQDYNEAVQDAANNFVDPALKRGEVVTNTLGLPVPRSGNFADVYQFKDGQGKMWALKCFTRKVPGLRERYAKIDEHLNKAKLPFTVGFKFMEQGIRVKGEWFPLLKMEWVEGFTLNDFVAENVSKPQYLHALMQMWAKLAGRLRDANMAHADLQHGNVLLVPGATPQKLGLKLIDYDGMWVPALSEFHSGEVGHPNFQHPLRLKEKLYNGDVDRFPHLVVAAALRATVVGGKAIWDRFDNGDNLLFKESDLRDPSKSQVFRTLWQLNDPVLCTLVGHMALTARQPLRKTPWLDDVLFQEGGPRLSSEEERQVCQILGVETQATATSAGVAAPTVQQEFNVFEFLDDDEPAPTRTQRTRGRSAPATRTRYSRRPQKKSKAPLLIGGGVLAACLVIGGVVLALGMGGGKKDPSTEVAQKKEKEKPKLPVGGGQVKPSPKETEKAEPRELRIVVVIDGKDELRLTKHTVQWVHHSWQWPQQVKLNEVEWNPQATPMMPNMGTDRLVSADVDDLRAAKLTKLRGRGTATLTAKMGSLAVVFDDDGHLGADTYEVVLSFNKAPVLPAGSPNTAAIAVAALSSGRDYLFIREKDPALYMTVNGSARDPRELGRHDSPITALARTPDGSQTITGDEDGEVRIWGLKAAPRMLKEHTAAVVACAVSPDGKSAVSVGADKMLCEWNLTEGKLIRKFNIPDPEAVAYLPDGKNVLLGTTSESAGIWDLEKQTRIKHLEGHTTPVRAIAISPKGDFAFTAGAEPSVKKWILPEGKLSGGIDFDQQGLSALAVSPDGLILAGAGPSGSIRFFDAATAKPRGGIAMPSPILAMAFANNTEIIAARAPNPMYIRVNRNDIPDGSAAIKLVHESEPLNEGGGRIGFSRDGKRFYLLQRSTFTVFEGDTGKQLNQFSLNGQFIDIALVADKQLFVATSDGKFQYWDWSTGKMVKETSLPEMKQPRVTNIHFTDDPNQLFVLTGSPFPMLWDVAEWKAIKRLQPYQNGVFARGHMYPSGTQIILELFAPPDGRRLAVWDIAKNQHLFDLERIDTKGLSNITVSPNGKWIVATTNDEAGKVFVWDAKTGKIAKTLASIQTRGLRGGFTADGDHFIFQEVASRRVVVDLEKDQVVDEMRPRVPTNAVAVSSQASLMATVDADRRLRLWRIGIDNKPAGVAVKDPPKSKSAFSLLHEGEPLPGNTAFVIGFSQDGKLYYCNQQGAITIFETATGKVLGRFDVDKAHHLAFGVGKRLYISTFDRKLQLWDWGTGKLLKEFSFGEPPQPVVVGIQQTSNPNRLLVLNQASAILWDVTAWKPVDQFNPYAGERFRSGKAYPNQSRVLVEIDGRDRTRLAVLDLVRKKNAFDLDMGESRSFGGAQLSPDGKWIVATGYSNNGKDAITYLFDSKTGKRVRTISSANAPHLGGGFTEDGNHFVFVELSGRPFIVNLEKDQIVEDSRQAISTRYLAISPTGGLIAAVGQERRIGIWRIKIDKPAAPIAKTSPKTPMPKEVVEHKEGRLKTSAEMSDTVSGCAFSSDGSKIYVSTHQGVVHILDAMKLEETAKLEVSKFRITHMVLKPKLSAASPEKLYLFDEGKEAHVWDPEKRARIKSFNLEKQMAKYINQVDELVVMPTESYLMAFDHARAGSISLDLTRNTYGILSALNRPPFAGNTRQVTFSSDARLGAAYASNKLMVWTVSTGVPVRTIDTTLTPNWISLAPEAKAVVATTFRQLHAWNYAAAGKTILDIRDPHGEFTRFTAATATKSEYMVTAGEDGQLRFWDLATGKSAANWRGGRIYKGVAMSPDGKYAVTWNLTDNTLTLWGGPKPKVDDRK